MSEQKRRSSLGINKAKIKTMEVVLDKFTSKEFIAGNSLFNNLLSSQELKIDLDSNDLLKTVFGVKAVCSRDLYQFSYFHQRDKKIILFNYILQFLRVTDKLEMVVMLNSDRMDYVELHQFLVSEKAVGGKDLWDEFKKRVFVYEIQNLNTFIFNLLYLSLLYKSREFLRSVIICDINTFQSSDKSALDKYYRKIPKQLAVLTFRKDFFQYKVTIKTALSFISEGGQEMTELNEKIIHYLHRKNQQFNYHFSQIIPFEYVYNTAKTIDETFKTILLRASINERVQEVVYWGHPFKLQSVKQI